MDLASMETCVRTVENQESKAQRETAMTTGQDVRELGLYMSNCCNAEVIFGVSDCFSRCPNCEGLCRWDLEEELISWEQLQEEEVEAA